MDLLTESISLDILARHSLLTMGLVGLKNGSEGMSMEFLLRTAEEWTMDDIFVEWAELYTPYKYSAKKKRLVRRNGGRWDLDGAFLNPLTRPAEQLEIEVEKFQKSLGLSLSAPVDLEAFIKYLEREKTERRRRIEERIERNRRKSKRSPPSGQNPEPENHPEATQNPETDQNPEPKGHPEKPFERQATPARQRRRRKLKKKRNRAAQTTQENGHASLKNDVPTPLSAKGLENQEARRKIEAYLARNPAPDPIGPMGVPQSRYRNGTYGLNSMEYDVWRRF